MKMTNQFAVRPTVILIITFTMLCSMRSSAQITQQGSKLVGTDASGIASQGTSVALSGDGNTMITGGFRDSNDTGAAWVFTRSGGVWTQQGSKLLGNGAIGTAFQGTGVALSADGNTAIVGGSGDNNNIGAAWIFTRSGGVWTQQGSKLMGNDAIGTASQGTRVGLSGDGNTAIVGGPGDNNNIGAVWVFTRSGGVWTQQGSKLVGSGATGNSSQGRGVALSADGNTALLGGESDNNGVGAAWVFTRSNGVWTQQGSKLVGGGAVGASFQGVTAALSGDGNTAIVGGTTDNGNIGAAWVFTRSGGVWTQQGNKLVGSGMNGKADQGVVALSADGNTAIVGGSGDAHDVGAAWVFTRSGGVWAQQGNKLVGTGEVGAGILALSVAASADGTTFLLGGPSDNSGTGATWVFTKSGGNTSLGLTLAAGGADTLRTRGGSGPVQAGYAKTTLTSGTAPYATAVFSFSAGGLVLSETGVPVSPLTLDGRIFVDFRTGVVPKSDQLDTGTVNIDTGFAVVNAGNATANITYTLSDRTGQNPITGHGTVPAGGHRAKFIDQLSDLAPDFALPASFSTTTQFGTLDIHSDQPLSILALRSTTNQRGDTLFTSTPIANLQPPPGKASDDPRVDILAAAPLFFAQLADGGGYHTVILLVNTSGNAETGKIQTFNDDGTPLVVQQVNGPSGSSFNYNIPANGVFVFQTDGSPAAIHVGSVQVTPDPGNSTPVGAGVFSFIQGGILVTESGIPAATPTTHARIYVDESGGHDTGLAIAAPTATPINVSVNAFQLDGVTPVGASLGTIALSGNGHIARFVGQLVSGLPAGFTGVLDLQSSSPFVALTLRILTNTRGDTLLTTFPVADLTQPAPNPIIFPQIADGGGFQTQFIYLSAGGGAGATVSFFGDDSSPLAVGKSDR